MPLILYRRPGDSFHIDDDVRVYLEKARKTPFPSEVTLRVEPGSETYVIRYRESIDIGNVIITLLHLTHTLKAKLLIRAPEAQRIVRTEVLNRSNA